jgi:hypothetical protein
VTASVLNSNKVTEVNLFSQVTDVLQFMQHLDAVHDERYATGERQQTHRQVAIRKLQEKHPQAPHAKPESQEYRYGDKE